MYPKNKLANKPVKELLKDDGSAEDVNQDRISYDIGKEIKYKVTYQIPMHIGDVITNADGTRQTRYRKLVFKDEVTHDAYALINLILSRLLEGRQKILRERLIHQLVLLP